MSRKQLFIRTFKDLWYYFKGILLLRILLAFLTHGVTFANFWYMSRVLSNLSYGHYDAIMPMIIRYLTIIGTLQLANALLRPIYGVRFTEMRRDLFDIPNKKMAVTEYTYVEDPNIQSLAFQVGRDQMQNNSSFYYICEHTLRALDSLVGMGMSLILMWPLWSYAQGAHWIDSYWVNVALIATMVSLIVIQILEMQRAVGILETKGGLIVRLNALAFYLINLLEDPESSKEIRLYHGESQFVKMWNEQIKKMIEFMAQFHKINSHSNLMAAFSEGVINTLIYLLIGARVILGSLPIGMVVQLMGAMNQLMTSMRGLLSLSSVFAQREPMDRFYQLLDLPDEKAQGTLPIEKRLDNDYQLSVKDLSFKYPGSDEEILKGITQDFEPGKRYAIVGENGSGKTTFIKLLLRLYEPTSGSVELNQVDGMKYSLAEWYQLYSVVFQDYRLLGLTLAENIAVSPEYDIDRVQRALHQVGLKASDFEQGVETYLGTEYQSNGSNVSGGQAQKIAMARALYKESPIMILDEPTAALDPIAEFEIYQHIDAMVEDRTAFYISHRLSSCRFCDEILVFDQGKIIQRGTHEALVHQPGKYSELWQAQAQYYQ